MGMEMVHLVKVDENLFIWGPFEETARLEHNRRAPQEHWAEVLNLEEMLQRFVWSPLNKAVVDTGSTLRAHKMHDFRDSYLASKTRMGGKVVQVTKLWEQHPEKRVR